MGRRYRRIGPAMAPCTVKSSIGPRPWSGMASNNLATALPHCAGGIPDTVCRCSDRPPELHSIPNAATSILSSNSTNLTPSDYAEAYFGLWEDCRRRSAGRSICLPRRRWRAPICAIPWNKAGWLCMPRDQHKYVYDIWQAVLGILNFTAGKAFEDYQADLLLRARRRASVRDRWRSALSTGARCSGNGRPHPRVPQNNQIQESPDTWLRNRWRTHRFGA